MPLKPRKTTSRSKRNIRKDLVEQTGDASLLFADGLDDAIIGYFDDSEPLRVVYDKQKVVKILMKQNKWGYDEANEYAHFNIYCAFVGERTPVFIGTIE